MVLKKQVARTGVPIGDFVIFFLSQEKKYLWQH